MPLIRSFPIFQSAIVLSQTQDTNTSQISKKSFEPNRRISTALCEATARTSTLEMALFNMHPIGFSCPDPHCPLNIYTVEGPVIMIHACSGYGRPTYAAGYGFTHHGIGHRETSGTDLCSNPICPNVIRDDLLTGANPFKLRRDEMNLLRSSNCGGSKNCREWTFALLAKARAERDSTKKDIAQQFRTIETELHQIDIVQTQLRIEDGKSGTCTCAGSTVSRKADALVSGMNRVQLEQGQSRSRADSCSQSRAVLTGRSRAETFGGSRLGYGSAVPTGRSRADPVAGSSADYGTPAATARSPADSIRGVRPEIGHDGRTAQSQVRSRMASVNGTRSGHGSAVPTGKSRAQSHAGSRTQYGTENRTAITQGRTSMDSVAASRASVGHQLTDTAYNSQGDIDRTITPETVKARTRVGSDAQSHSSRMPIASAHQTSRSRAPSISSHRSSAEPTSGARGYEYEPYHSTTGPTSAHLETGRPELSASDVKSVHFEKPSSRRSSASTQYANTQRAFTSHHSHATAQTGASYTPIAQQIMATTDIKSLAAAWWEDMQPLLNNQHAQIDYFPDPPKGAPIEALLRELRNYPDCLKQLRIAFHPDRMSSVPKHKVRTYKQRAMEMYNVVDRRHAQHKAKMLA